MTEERDIHKAAFELRNFANTLLNMGGVTPHYVTELLSLATRLDGNQPDERFSDIPKRLANRPAETEDRR
jgi:hypothetical protein